MPAGVVINSTPVKADDDDLGNGLSPTHPSFVPVNDLSSDEGEGNAGAAGGSGVMNSTLLSRNLDVLPVASLSPNSNEEFNNEQELSDCWDQVELLEFQMIII